MKNTSRRSFFGAAAGAAGLAAFPELLIAQATPAEPGLPSAYPITAPDINWKLECRYTTGGAPYRPAFSAMFVDELFFQIHVGPNDLGPATSPSVGARVSTGGEGGGRGGGRAGGRGAAAAGGAAAGAAPGTAAPLGPTGNAPLNRSTTMPNDLPLIPSGGGAGVGLLSLTTFSPSVVLLNDQTNWAQTSRDETEAAYKANQELIGVVVFHNAIGDNQDWPMWYQEITGGQLVLADRADAKKSTITKNASFDVKPVGTHPIVLDMPSYRVTGEEAYKGMWQAKNITPLVEATGAATDRVVAWVGPNPTKARVVNIAYGSSSETLRNPAFRRLVRNAILWAGHRLD